MSRPGSIAGQSHPAAHTTSLTQLSFDSEVVMSTTQQRLHEQLMEACEALHCPPDELAFALQIDLATLGLYQDGERAIPSRLGGAIRDLLRARAEQILRIAAEMGGEEESDEGAWPRPVAAVESGDRGPRWVWGSPELPRRFREHARSAQKPPRPRWAVGVRIAQRGTEAG